MTRRSDTGSTGHPLDHPAGNGGPALRPGTGVTRLRPVEGPSFGEPTLGIVPEFSASGTSSGRHHLYRPEYGDVTEPGEEKRYCSKEGESSRARPVLMQALRGG